MDSRIPAKDGVLRERRSAAPMLALVATLAVGCIAGTVWIWSGSLANHLSLEQSVRVLRDADDASSVHTAAIQTFTHVERAIAALRLVAQRDDSVGQDVRILLDRLRVSVQR